MAALLLLAFPSPPTRLLMLAVIAASSGSESCWLALPHAKQATFLGLHCRERASAFLECSLHTRPDQGSVPTSPNRAGLGGYPRGRLSDLMPAHAPRGLSAQLHSCCTITGRGSGAQGGQERAGHLRLPCWPGTQHCRAFQDGAPLIPHPGLGRGCLASWHPPCSVLGWEPSCSPEWSGRVEGSTVVMLQSSQ